MSIRKPTRRDFLRYAGAAFAGAVAGKAFAGPDDPLDYKRNWGGNFYQPRFRKDYISPDIATGRADPVGVAIVLSMDSSGSMTDEEWKIQLRGTANALLPRAAGGPTGHDPLGGLVESAIRHKSGVKSVAIAVVDFSSEASMRIPWVDLRADDPDLPLRMQLLAARIATLPRHHSGSTELTEMLQYVDTVFQNCPWEVKEKRVLDVSCDGEEGDALGPLQAQRDLLAAKGVTINALAIVNEVPHLEKYFYDNIVTQKAVRSPDGILTEPGRVWAIARNMKSQGNNINTLMSFDREVEMALKMKISMEVSDEGTVRGLIRQTDINALGKDVIEGLIPRRPADNGKPPFIFRP